MRFTHGGLTSDSRARINAMVKERIQLLPISYYEKSRRNEYGCWIWSGGSENSDMDTFRDGFVPRDLYILLLRDTLFTHLVMKHRC